MVRTTGFHPVNLGSTPGKNVFFCRNCLVACINIGIMLQIHLVFYLRLIFDLTLIYVFLNLSFYVVFIFLLQT